MMISKQPAYLDYCRYYASKCNVCKGDKRLWKDDAWYSCGCQYIATVKYRFDRIRIYPPSLKYLSWKDFTGEIKEVSKSGKLEITDHLEPAAILQAKRNAMQYCFGSTDPAVLKNRPKNSIIYKRFLSGKNVIIAGSKQTGKSLLATLILKEVVHASVQNQVDMSFEWIKGTDLFHAARWDTSKDVDYDSLYEWADVSFLVIDGLGMSRGGHTSPPDVIAFNRLFGSRHYEKPTIIITTDSFVRECQDSLRSSLVVDKLGEELHSLMIDKDNILIDLYKNQSRQFSREK